MGASASKPGRKLTKVVSETAKAKPLNRSTNVNPLPSQTLKDRFEQQPISQQSIPVEPTREETAPQMTVQTPQQDAQSPAFRSTSSFDPSFLSKKLNKQTVIPEGKDGGDPHVEGTDTYQRGFVDSVTKLGKHVQSVEYNPLMNKNVLALKQLQFRKTISEQGEKELESEKNNENGEEMFKTMVHPHTLTAILSDLKDPRMTPESITKDYQLHPDFLKELGDRFKIPTTRKPIEEEKPKEDEFISGVEVDSAMQFEEPESKVDRERFKKLKSRLE
ncbi:uncharacterized protein SPAPADRAFT_138825 [Spathaspora passalidarum NRRL Y-27907]|uniref:Uncharacterized protein n=1 Tax=Spathaspora passalidarum (strain NRRL Y-27907 / 11-Y1) TaxID=619300 RepID=G3APY5_SPAPN|nr:uncharacterized protein SPAPADRAFT_138825 [Spathaspora passalidarum NRRL Y-27907]EGW32306.1 hypothetical protein SPAPADRAFT_138825 [Spathaspora passalidarum NRRL Y-27907]